MCWPWQEARDILVGKLFGLGALVRSGLLSPPSTKPTPSSAKGVGGGAAKGGKAGKASAAVASAAEGVAVAAEEHRLLHCCWAIRELLALGARKSFLREAAAGAVLELMAALGPEMAAKVSLGLPLWFPHPGPYPTHALCLGPLRMYLYCL